MDQSWLALVAQRNFRPQVQGFFPHRYTGTAGKNRLDSIDNLILKRNEAKTKREQSKEMVDDVKAFSIPFWRCEVFQ